MTGLAGAPLLPPGRRFVLCPAAQTPIHPQPLEMWGGQPGAGVVSLQAQGMAQPPLLGSTMAPREAPHRPQQAQLTHPSY